MNNKLVDITIQEILELAKSKDQTERMEAAYLIGELQEVPPEIWDILKELMQDEYLEVQTTANEAIKKILRMEMDNNREMEND